MKADLIGAERLEEVNVRLLAAFSYEPKVMRNFINNRRFSALVYVIKGKYIYRSGGQEIVLTPDTCIYLPPCGQDYSYEIESEETETVQVDFELTREGKQVALSRAPQKIETDMDQLKALMRRLSLARPKDTPSGRLEVKARMTMFLSLLASRAAGTKRAKEEQKIAPALEWIEANFREAFSSEELALGCHLSQSQLRRLFKTVTGMTPMEYRNALRINAAAGMLIGGDKSVSEVAFALGFEDIYAFSHAFKKQKGIAPSLYRGEME